MKQADQPLTTALHPTILAISQSNGQHNKGPFEYPTYLNYRVTSLPLEFAKEWN